MSVRKRNEFLEGYDSEDYFDTGYDSEANEESRGDISGRSKKRRRLSGSASDDELLDEIDNDGGHDGAQDSRFAIFKSNLELDEEDANIDEQGEDEPLLDDRPKSLPGKLNKNAIKSAEKAAKAARKTGVLYISRVPPFMKPQTLKHFLEPHASKGLGRIFLTPESSTSHTRRVRNGGNKKKSYTDGWVEFVSKKEAKEAAEVLNGNIIGGKKGGYYHDDLWSMKYLKGFKWSHLTEQIANENAERAARMREEIRKTRQENKTFLQDVEQGKMLEGMESKRKAKQERRGGDDAIARTHSKPKKDFKQKPVRQPPDEVSHKGSVARGLIF